METAWVWSKRSTCYRLNVGAVIVVDNNIVSHGYNGQRPGDPHCPGNDCPGRVPGMCNTIHAERNAIMRVPGDLRDVEKDAYTTHMPCVSCAELLLERNVRRLFYSIPYRLTGGVDRLILLGAKVYRVTPAGYVINHETEEVIELP